MSKKKQEDINITLSPIQVEQVMRSAGQQRNGTVSNLLLAALDNAYRPANGRMDAYRSRRQPQGAPGGPQRSPALAVAAAGPGDPGLHGPDRPWRAIIDLAQQLDMSPSTTHRYVKTLRAVGLLEQNPPPVNTARSRCEAPGREQRQSLTG
jgi:hypothetical protein